jgi:uncharacterized phage-associated protein
MIRFRFNEQKAIAAILYISKLLQSEGIRVDFHRFFKILYFADSEHLSEYGRPIIGDHYIAMKDGPVPSNIYDILKIVRGDSIFEKCKNYSEYFEVYKNYFIKPKQEANLEELSESDIECLDDSFSKNKKLSYKELKKKSHDSAYYNATRDDKIDFKEMAKVRGADEDMLSYIKLNSENERVF